MRFAVLGVLFFAAPVFASGFPPPAHELEALDVQAGHWIYHGTTTPNKAGGKAGTFTWDEHCGWSADKLFLICSFDNDWSGHKVQSLVADTWNARDKSYWGTTLILRTLQRRPIMGHQEECHATEKALQRRVQARSRGSDPASGRQRFADCPRLGHWCEPDPSVAA